MITFSSRCGSESRREPKREGVVPYRNRSNVGPTIAHPAPAAILIRHELRLDIWGIGTATGQIPKRCSAFPNRVSVTPGSGFRLANLRETGAVETRVTLF